MFLMMAIGPGADPLRIRLESPLPCPSSRVPRRAAA
jgi:hypothetical protein